MKESIPIFVEVRDSGNGFTVSAWRVKRIGLEDRIPSDYLESTFSRIAVPATAENVSAVLTSIASKILARV